MHDEPLVAEYLRARDPELFRVLVERHQARVFRLVAGLLGPFADTDAQEVTQEVFLRAHEKLASFRGEARFSSWLYRLAYNFTLQHRRRARLRLPHVAVEALENLTAAGGPHEAAAERQRQLKVERLLEGLPDLYRTVVYLHYLARRDGRGDRGAHRRAGGHREVLPVAGPAAAAGAREGRGDRGSRVMPSESDGLRRLLARHPPPRLAEDFAEGLMRRVQQDERARRPAAQPRKTAGAGRVLARRPCQPRQRS